VNNITAKTITDEQIRDIVTTCPDCGLLHLDVGAWRDRPHRTHLCAGCGRLWRPSEGHTRGVEATADTITDEMIRVMRDTIELKMFDRTVNVRDDLDECAIALREWSGISDDRRSEARARCAKILNARQVESS
jgi:hypothetical protein